MFDIAELADPWTVQAPWMTPEQIRDNLNEQVKAGIAQFYWSSDGNTCWFVRRCTNRVAEVHLFSKSRKILKNCREIQQLVWDNTEYRKLEMRTHIKGVWALAKKIGWSFEGTRMGSIELRDGSIVHEKMYGVMR